MDEDKSLHDDGSTLKLRGKMSPMTPRRDKPMNEAPALRTAQLPSPVCISISQSILNDWTH